MGGEQEQDRICHICGSREKLRYEAVAIGAELDGRIIYCQKLICTGCKKLTGK